MVVLNCRERGCADLLQSFKSLIRADSKLRRARSCSGRLAHRSKARRCQARAAGRCSCSAASRTADCARTAGGHSSSSCISYRHASRWAVVNAALAAGLYPNVLRMDGGTFMCSGTGAVAAGGGGGGGGRGGRRKFYSREHGLLKLHPGSVNVALEGGVVPTGSGVGSNWDNLVLLPSVTLMAGGGQGVASLSVVEEPAMGTLDLWPTWAKE